MRLFTALAETLPWRRSKVRPRYEPAYAARDATVETVQGALRAAERGDTRKLFALYRDLTAGGSHIQAEFAKRKMAVLAQPAAILPAHKERPEDLAAAAAVQRMVDGCENWTDGLAHLLDACLWPVSVVEKVYRPGEAGEPRYMLRRMEPVDPQVLCFRAEPEMMLEGWEAELRFWRVERGAVLYDLRQSYPADRTRHLVHRGHLLTGMRDCWGGPMRAVVFWWLLGVLGRDWFARSMERYGVPFVVGHTDAQNAEAVQFLTDAFASATKIGGLVVDHEAQVDLKEIALSGAADAHVKFLSFCNREISKVIVGQTLSAEAAPTGLGSGTADLQGGVREDIRMFDQLRLGETLRTQLFGPWLRLNGLTGEPPRLVLGGLGDADAKLFGDLLEVLSRAGWEPTDEAIPLMQDRLGFGLQRKASMGGGFGGGGALMGLSARQPHPSDRIAEARAAVLGQAYRGAMAPFRQIILSSGTPEECERRLRAAYADWEPVRLAAELETALQLCAAAGAGRDG